MRRRALSVGTQAAVALGGVAALSWEVVWQIHAALSLGVSALGTALTLAATMAGMTIGSLAMGRALRLRESVRPLRLYGYLEGVIGLAGLLVGTGFAWIEQLDAAVYAWSPGAAPLFHVVSIALLLGPPTMAMGATVPIFELMGRQTGTSVARLYGINTAGAAIGVLLLTFVLVPELGVGTTCVVVAALNVVVLLFMQGLDRAVPVLEVEAGAASEAAAAPARSPLMRWAPWIVFGTGFATFALEVAWFRSLRAAFQSTTEVFAIILASVLIPLAVAARLVPWLRRRGVQPAALLAAAAVLILLTTPLVERMDLLGGPVPGAYTKLLTVWMGLSLAVLGPAVLFLGMPLPWFLEQAAEPSAAGRLYAINTLGAVCGSLGAAWVLLPTLGFSRSAWLLGSVLAALAVALLARRRVWAIGVVTASALALFFAVHFTASLGRDRIVSAHDLRSFELLAFDEGPDSTVAVVESPEGIRSLMIDGFGASSELAPGSSYMDWMGRLPMLLHENPRKALVLCFGTGNTARSVLDEGVATLDVVDVNGTVFEMAPLFRTNGRVLEDARVHPIVMDGRAWLRRTDTIYDVITLEPMPPYFAGVNALYSQDFYEIMAERLAPDGVAAQWLPIHLVPPYFSESVVAAFRAVFTDSILWLDPVAGTAILLGRKTGSAAPLGRDWPGFARDFERSLSAEAIRAGVLLDPIGMTIYAEGGAPITDDNQLLSYGMLRRELHETQFAGSRKANLDAIRLLSSIRAN
ncbi:MAG: fused MFS/spermidine synthase [Myxococcota bacterium]|nr:fused MFS/spermidine synthase [Myxococcota bacterium]